MAIPTQQAARENPPAEVSPPGPWPTAPTPAENTQDPFPGAPRQLPPTLCAAGEHFIFLQHAPELSVASL